MTEKRGRFQDHLEWAQSNPENGLSKQFMDLASMYTRRPEHATLGLIEACAKDIEKEPTFQGRRHETAHDS